MTRWWQTRAAALTFVLLTALPLLWPDVAPLTDLPGHMGRYRVMLETHPHLKDWYRFEWRLTGNLGVDLLVRGLAPLVGLEWAVKLVILAIPPLTATGLLWISHEAHGRIQPLALIALPLAYSHPFQFGFVNYALSLALALNAFALWLRLAQQPRLRAMLFVPISGLVWLAHAMGWGILGLLAFGAELARDRHPKALLRCLPLALPLFLILLWRAEESDGTTERFFDWRFKAGWLAMIFRDRWQLLDIASTALVAGLLYRSWRHRGDSQAPALAWGAALLFVAFVLMPFILFVSAYADMRLAPVVAMLALLAVRSDAIDAPRLALLASAFVLLRIGAATVSAAQESQAWNDRLAALDHLPPNSRLVTLVGTHCRPPWSLDRRVHLPSLALARRGAFANDQWRLGGGSPLSVIIRGPFAADPTQMVLDRPCRSFRNRRTIAQALAIVPRSNANYLWLIDPPSFDPRLVPFRLVWGNGHSFLYQIERRRLSAIPR